MLASPKNRTCPSRSFSSCSNVRRQPPGERKGKMPSNTSIRASAAQRTFQSNAAYRRGPAAGATGALPPPLRNARKKSVLFGSTTITSLFLLKLAL